MDTTTNPYASPREVEEAIPSDGADALSPAQRKRLELGEVFVAWEQRRLVYNLLLAGVSLLVIVPRVAMQEVDWRHAAMLTILALPANLFFCAGPLVDGYWTWLIGPARWLRELLFWGGTLFSIFLAIEFCRQIT